MKTFMAFYTGTASDEDKARDAAEDTADRDARGMAAWGQWMQDHQNVIVDPGAPLGKTLRASAKGVEPWRNNLAGYIVVRAETHEDAAKYFLDHPHFAIFPGDAIEIVEILPMPGA